MRNILLALEYDGTAYCGFQRQSHVRTIQATVESALSRHAGEEIHLNAASRTDSGVHASSQVIDFFTANPVPIGRACEAINSLLPLDIGAWQAMEVHPDFHARRCASSKVYHYLIHDGSPRPAILGRFCSYHPTPLDVEAMDKSLIPLIGQHDFLAFSAKGDERKTTVCHLIEGRCWREGPLVKVRLRAPGFLYRMVRLIVGGLTKVGEGRWKPERLGEILVSRRRSEAPPAALARGLFLTEVAYACDHLNATFRKEVL